MKRLFYSLLLAIFLSQPILAQSVAQWRGPNRDGVFPENGLLKSWPVEGPELLWAQDSLDNGFSSVSVTDEAVYLTGRKDSTEFLTVFDLKGNQLWRLPYGLGVRKSFPETRCTPTVEGQRIYLISGRGDVVCVNGKKQKIEWSVPAFEKFEGQYWQWEIAESPLLVDDKVIYTPAGHKTTMVALDKHTGKTIWQTETLDDTSAFVSPILIEFGGRKIIVNLTIKYIFGVDAQDGKILWKVNYAEIQPPTFHPWAPKNNCVTPLYRDGHLFVTSGYGHVGIMLKLINNGNAVQQEWINSDLDNHHGQVVKIGDYIYGSNWIDNSNGNWCCVDWNTGKTIYEKEWHCKGPISAADGMLYCYDEKRGNFALVEPTPEDFKVISSFRIRSGRGPHWTQPVLHNGVLYVRHGNALMAYDVRK